MLRAALSAVRASSALLLALGATGGCASSPPPSLLVDVRTDLVPAVELDRVRTERLAPGSADPLEVHEVPATEGDFARGVRVAELSGLARGTHIVHVVLLLRDAVVLDRLVLVTLDATRAVTVVLTRDCRGVTCPEPDDAPTASACLGGRCTDPACTPETPERCPEGPDCAADADCPAGASCAEPVCAGGACLLVARTGGCEAGAWCDPEAGCRPLEPGPDAGLTDAGVSDAGVSDAALLDGSAACSEGTFGGSEYRFCGTRTSWVDARAQCLVWGGPRAHLADIETFEEQEWLRAEVSARIGTTTPSGFHTGGNDMAEEGVWRWSDGTLFHDRGTPVGFDNGFRESTVGDEDCLESVVRGGGWNDLGCDDTRAFVCERTP